MTCCGEWIPWCCSCQGNMSPGSGGGAWKAKKVGEHYYCYKCFPAMVDVYIADQKLKQFTGDL